MPNFSDKYQKLEEILEWFESEEFDLDKADKKFDEGLELVDELTKRLKESKQKISKLENKLED